MLIQTKVTFSSDVSIDGQTLNAEFYGLYTVPNENSWESFSILSLSNSGVPRDWDDTKISCKNGKTWRTGANSNTKVTFSSDVSIDGQTLNAGSYGLYTVPNENSWEIIFYSESDNSGVPRDWDDTKIVAKTSVEVYSMPMNVETFTITFDDVSSTSAVIGLLWEKTYVGIKFEVPTDKLVSETIDAVMAASPEAGDYYNAAIYYRQQELDIKKANEWMEKAMSLTENPAFWQLRQQSLIYAKMGDTEKAIAVAEKSLELSKKAGNEAYIKMNTQSLAEWSVK